MHKSVLLQQTVDLISPKKGGVYIDATVGAGGHTKELCSRIGKTGRVLAIDQDKKALKIAQKNLAGQNVVFAHGNFNEIAVIAKKNGFKSVDGIIADIGVSSMQIDEAARGFSFSKRAKLDMRMNQEGLLTAQKVINEYPEEELARIFREYGEEPYARRVAKEIALERSRNQIIWTDQLSEVVRRVIKRKTKIDPATKVFQALRIEVNQELFALESALPQIVGILKGGGRMAVISFHSLEDRIVKQFIESRSRTCTCPPDFPKCVCDTKPELKKITKKPVMASMQEIRENPRSRSARLRVAEKL